MEVTLTAVPHLAAFRSRALRLKTFQDLVRSQAADITSSSPAEAVRAQTGRGLMSL
jgi:hypothetical protein